MRCRPRGVRLVCGSFESARDARGGGRFPLRRSAVRAAEPDRELHVVHGAALRRGGSGAPAAARHRRSPRRGCHVLVSNSTATEIAALYEHSRDARAAGLRAFRVPARRAINSNAARRGPVDEYPDYELFRRRRARRADGTAGRRTPCAGRRRTRRTRPRPGSRTRGRSPRRRGVDASPRGAGARWSDTEWRRGWHRAATREADRRRPVCQRKRP